jgi:hypothetical protein
MRRFAAPDEIVVGYDETAFPKSAVEAVRVAWRRLAPARTMPFLRSDAEAPAAVLVSFGKFSEDDRAIARFDDVAAARWAEARRVLQDMFGASSKPLPELQFRFDVGARIVRGRFHPRPGEIDAALCGLAALARALAEDARGPLSGAIRVVTATWDGARWRQAEARGYERPQDRADGHLVRLHHTDRGWTPS